MTTERSKENPQCYNVIHSHHKNIHAFEQIGGHPNQWFVDETTSRECVKKSTNCNEAIFYWWVNQHPKGHSIQLFVTPTCKEKISVKNALQRFQDNVPSYPFGSKTLLEKLVAMIPRCSTLGIPLVPSKDKVYHVEMENLYLKFNRPCVMDIKMGTRRHGNDASFEKRQRMILKSNNSTSLCYGVSLTAWRIWNTSTNVMEIMTREEARKLVTLTDFQQGRGLHRYVMTRNYTLLLHVEAFQRYFNAVEIQHRKSLALLFKEKLQILNLWFSTQKIANFYSSSLLFLYDADSPSIADMRMIDFAHVTFNPNSIDTGYIFGLTTLLNLLSDYV